MSTFEKVPQGDVLDYHTTSLNDPNSYASFAQPPYATHLLLPSALSEDNDQLHYVTSSDLSGPNDPYDENRSSFFDPRLRQGLEITSYTPADGTKGTRVYVNVRTYHDLIAPPALSIFLSFGSKRIECLIEQIPSTHVELKQYVLSSEVPSFPSTGYHSFTVPLHLVMEGAGGSTSAPQVVEVGAFTYLGPPATSATQDLSRKRKLSSGSDDILHSSMKRSSGTGLRAQDAAGEYAYNTSAASPYSPFLPTPTGSGLHQNRYSQGTSPRSYGHQYSTSTASQPSIKAPSPHTPSFSPSMTTVKKAPRSPGVVGTPAGRQSESLSEDKVPALVRTSTIPTFGETVGPSPSASSFNPYAIYPQKATLKLNGNLDVMAENWTREEWETRRRLVQFTRRQSGSTIHADFKPIPQEERQQNMICISCIWWEEKQECFVTSVDTIYLLEALVAVRFTVEEKNRIRRNLEGFRPLTVSKAKSDSEDFFKLIMGFPNPKPRNIEKDVKVFPWKILAHALKKIISKYSASYSSTAGALPSTPQTYSTSRASQSINIEPRGVPRPVSFPTVMPRPVQAQPPASSSSIELRLQVPATTNAGLSVPATYPFQPQHMGHPQPHMTQPMSAPGSRLSAYDFVPFGNPNTSMPSTGHTYTYHRSMPANTQAYSMSQMDFPTGYPTTSG